MDIDLMDRRIQNVLGEKRGDQQGYCEVKHGAGGTVTWNFQQRNESGMTNSHA